MEQKTDNKMKQGRYREITLQGATEKGILLTANQNNFSI